MQKQNGLEKQEQMHVARIKKHEHNLTQQRSMLEEVQIRLGAVRDEVNDLRALVSENKESTGPPVRPLPPCPREPPLDDDEHPGPDINVASTPIDVDTDMEEDVEEWQTVLRTSRKKKVLVKLKGTQRR